MKDGKKTEIAKREETIQEYWEKNDIFKKTLEKDAPQGEYVFYDGPPFATGTPHYGHLVASAMKDAVPRYFTMRGFRVERQWGWDCHGLPIENIVEQELGTKSKKEIEEIGVKKFNELCREKIFTYVDVWNKVIPRFGRWADMENPYRTMDKDYMESEWWAFKQLYDKGLVYEDYRSLHICPRCETTLAQSEVAEGYTDVKDISVIAKFELLDEPGTFLLAWTTTPWTLPGNAALAVGADVTYVIAESEGEKFIFAKERAEEVFKDKSFTALQEVDGSELVGRAYKPLFDYYANDENLINRENGWKAYAADFVSTEEGTGVVHIAPAFGQDDMDLGKEEQLPFIQHVGMDGRFKPEVADFAGLFVKPKEDPMETDVEIIKYLAHNNLLFAKKKIEHSYPLCWRCDTPLLNYAMSSWFVAVQKIKSELTENAKNIHWSPRHMKEGRWGGWLESARDWSISRQRFWANTIPVWRCSECDAERVFGSAGELSEASGKEVTDLHKDIVDEITVPCLSGQGLSGQGECGGEMRRVPDVLDTWFNSGSVPFASYHYPFENEKKVRERIPADFIAEGQDQVSKWFYYQHVLSGALFGRAAFKNVIVNGIVLAEDGRKMSKRLQNYPDPVGVIDKYGADAVRLYLLSSPVMRAENLNFSEAGVDEVAKKVIGRLANVVSFYKLYENPQKGAPEESAHVLDRWILARLNKFTLNVTEAMDAYALDRAGREFGAFVDDLSVWYVRRSRERIKEGGDSAHEALSTLRHVLLTYAKVSAPFTPFIAEWIWQEAQGGGESVHLTDWPDFEVPSEDILVAMNDVRRIVSLALEQRSRADIKVRQPLKTLKINYLQPEGAASADMAEYEVLIKEEVNVKKIEWNADEPHEVALDTTITPELEEEGMYRELARMVQDERKKLGLKVEDAAVLSVVADGKWRTVAEKYAPDLKRAANLTEFKVERGDDGIKIILSHHF